MARFRKKPVEIEAFQWLGNREDIAPLLNERCEIMEPGDGTLRILTLEGEMTASHGDWIIRGVKGEVYPCKPDIFEATYDAVVPAGESRIAKINERSRRALEAARHTDEERKVVSIFDRQPISHIEREESDEPETDRPELEGPIVDDDLVETLNMALDMAKSGRVNGGIVVMGLCLADEDPTMVTDATTLMSLNVHDDITIFMGGLELAKADLFHLYDEMADDED